MQLIRSLRLCLIATSILAVTAGPVNARTSVDPATLNPPPPDFFNADCQASGVNTICALAFSDPDIVDAPSGIVCGGVELLFSQTRSVVGKRFYNGDGNLTQRHFREFMAGTFTNPDGGPGVNWVQHDTIIHSLAVPGDLGSGTTRISGLFTRAWLPGGGTVFTDVGMFLIDASTEETIRAAGKHPFDAYFSGADLGALDALCGALD